jgi:ribonucleoside-diphosphate reductase alpha chain
MINDEFMHKVKSGDYEARVKWAELLKTRLETGESYIMFNDTVNRANPAAYKNNGLEVNMTNICSEITLFADQLHSFICCLSSLNLSMTDELLAYKSPRTGRTVPEIVTRLLNGVLDEFIDKAANIPFMDSTARSAIKGRAIGIGAMGWPTYLQENGIAFESFRAMSENNRVFKFIDENAKKASRELAVEKGEPEWCKGTGMYNSHLTAIAPTRSNSIICGDISAGIEPLTANAFNDITAKGLFVRRNRTLKKLLVKKGVDSPEVWKSIVKNAGSVQHLDVLTDAEKAVFKTAYEIDQNVIVQQAAQRQKYICQSQSLNLFFPFDVDALYFNQVHIKAWELGVKTLYYCKSTSGLKGLQQESEDCLSCEG